MPTTNEDIRQTILQRLHILTVATIILVVVSALIIAFVVVDSARRREALQRETDRTTAALCTLRADLQSRVTASQEFLLAHPNGIADIPVASIRTSIAGQKQTIAALHVLNCEP